MAIYSASHRWARISARKVRLAAALVRGMGVNRAIDVLASQPQRGAYMLLKVLKSAVSNAAAADADVDSMTVSRCWVDGGPLLQGRVRWRPGPMGRIKPYRKRTSHIHVELAEAVAVPVTAVADIEEDA